MSNAAIVAQLAIGIVFLLSSIGKLQDPRAFTRGLAAYKVIPLPWVGVASLLIIGLEIFIAITHLTGHLLEIALPIGLGLIVTFCVGVGLNLRRGRAVPCHCFGGSTSVISAKTLLRLFLLAAGELFLMKLSRPVFPEFLAAAELGAALFWSATLLVTFLWLFAFEDVIALLRSVVKA